MRILIVDDDPQILDSLTMGFQAHWKDAEVLAAADGENGLKRFFDRPPDVVLLDVGLPRMSGFEMLQEIRRVSDVPVIILTARGQEPDQVRGLELGADDYVVKPFGYRALIARIHAVLRRVEMAALRLVAPDFVYGELAVNFEDGLVSLQGRPVRLTPLEFKLLGLLIRNQGRVVTHQALINRLWGEEYGATTDHLKVFVSRLRSKIQLPDGFQYVETERGLGYRFVGQQDSQHREN